MRNGTKVLALNICFELPDEFEGGFNDALKEVVTYREKKGCPVMATKDESRKHRGIPPRPDDLIWKGFLEALDEGNKLFGACFIGTYENGEWVHAREE